MSIKHNSYLNTASEFDTNHIPCAFHIILLVSFSNLNSQSLNVRSIIKTKQKEWKRFSFEISLCILLISVIFLNAEMSNKIPKIFFFSFLHLIHQINPRCAFCRGITLLIAFISYNLRCAIFMAYEENFFCFFREYSV